MPQRWPRLGQRADGKGKLFKITYADKEHPQPVLVYPSSPREVRIEFDRPVDPQLLRDVLSQTKLTAGKFVRAGDRFETLFPGYAVVQRQKRTPRFNVPIHSAQLTPDRRTLVLATDPLHSRGPLRPTLPAWADRRTRGERSVPPTPASRSRLRPERGRSNVAFSRRQEAVERLAAVRGPESVTRIHGRLRSHNALGTR